MLEDLLGAQEKCTRILIKDACDNPGRILLLNWISYLVKRYDKVILLCSERPPEFFSNWLCPDLRDRLITICCNTQLPFEARAGSVLNQVAEILSKNSGQCAVVFDSLTPFILTDGVPTTCSLLHRLSSDEAIVQVVAVLHQDVHDDQSCDLVEHICPTVLTLKSFIDNKHVCNIRHCRPSGKVFRTDEHFTLDDSFHIHKMGQYKEEKKSTPAHQEADKGVPDLNLPFNLSLTEKEKVDRSQVKLPYLKDNSEETSTPPSKIHYEPDEADDFDEEDPDDDLNI